MEVIYETCLLTFSFYSVASGSPCDFSWTVETNECVSDAAVVVEDSTQPNTSHKDGTFIITLPHLRMSEIFRREMPVQYEKFEQSDSVPVQNDVNRLNSKDKQECLKEPQSLVTQENSIAGLESLLNVTKVIVTMDPDESSYDSSADWPDHASYAIHSSDTAKKASNPNDTDTTNNVTEANITVSTQTRNKIFEQINSKGSTLRKLDLFPSSAEKVGSTYSVGFVRKS
jgi:hypothetical protein